MSDFKCLSENCKCEAFIEERRATNWNGKDVPEFRVGHCRGCGLPQIISQGKVFRVVDFTGGDG